MTDPTGTPMTPNGSWHRGKMLAIAAFVTVAVAGVLSGAALDRYVLFLWGRPDARPPIDGPRGRGGPDGRGRFGNGGGRGPVPPDARLMAELDLTAAQRAGIDSLLDRQAAKLRAVRERVRPEIDSLVKETEREVAARLTATQRTRYDELRRQMRRGRRGGPPPS